RTAQGNPVALVTCWDVLKTPNGKLLENTKALPRSNPIIDPPAMIRNRFFDDSVSKGGMARTRTRAYGVAEGWASTLLISLSCCIPRLYRIRRASAALSS